MMARRKSDDAFAPITDLGCRVTSLTPATAKSWDVRLTPERKIAPQLFGIEGITSRTIGVRSAQSLRPLRCGMMLACPSRSDACRPSPEVDGGGRVLERTQNAI